MKQKINKLSCSISAAMILTWQPSGTICVAHCTFVENTIYSIDFIMSVYDVPLKNSCKGAKLGAIAYGRYKFSRSEAKFVVQKS